jgi:hypothetical protein
MFFPRRNSEAPDPGRFTALRVSLNAPVVATEELASGPARAAILQFWRPDERIAIEVRLRSAADGRVVVYDYDGPLDAASDIDHAFEAALNFAEGMGFLFDEDVLSSEDTVSRARVAEAWSRFEAGLAPAVRAALGTPGEPLGGDDLPEICGDELELTELAPGVVPPVSPHDAALAQELASDWTPLDDGPAVEAPAVAKPPAPAHAAAGPGPKPRPKPNPRPEPAAVRPEPAAARPEPAPARPEPATLTKFRGRAEGPPAARPEPASASEESGRSTLGRVPLVRRRGAGDGGLPKPGLLVRILGAF